MALTPGQLRTGSVTVDGTEIGFRSLSRSEALHIQGMSPEEAEPFIAARATDSTEDEATKWLDTHDVDEGNELITAICKLSRLGKGTGDPKA